MSDISSRERVLTSLNFERPDRCPKDLGGMASTSISTFAYPKLVQQLGLPWRRHRTHDTMQMLAFPDMDVLDALGCDVVTIFYGATNAFDEPAKWQNYDFNGRLKSRVRDKSIFVDLPDGSITQPQWNVSMSPNAVVFNEEHAGQAMDLSANLPKPDLEDVLRQEKTSLPAPEQIKDLRELCRHVRQTSDKAVFFNGEIYTGIAITAPGGLAVYPMICLTEPEYAAQLHSIRIEYAIKRCEMILPEIAPYIDIIMAASDDWGTQNNLIAPPRIFDELFTPYLKKYNKAVHEIAPGVKTFMHSCGAIYDIIDKIIESGFDILNPVQWCAGNKSHRDWKDKARGRIALWGGGIDTQHTLPYGSIEDVRNESREIAQYMIQDGGYVFNAIHNLLAEVDPAKVAAMYEAADV
jgi:uroporphyrinogen decarboxylase